jgi:hypothetical protein
MTQLSLKSGLKQWGDKAYAAVTLEMKQATTFLEHVQAKALEQTIKDSALDSVRSSHVPQGEMRWTP